MRVEHAFLPPEALPLFMFLSVPIFLAWLRKFLLRFQPKCPFIRRSLGHNIRKIVSNRLVLTEQLQEKVLADFPEYSSTSVLGVTDQS